MNIDVRPNQQAQYDFMRDLEPGWTLYQGGLGSGKSWAGARKFLMLHLQNKCPGLMVAPTFGDLGRFMIPALLEALQHYKLKYKIFSNGSSTYKYPHILVKGQPIILMSAEKAERITGFEVGHIWVDEGAKIRQNIKDPTRCPWIQTPTRLRHKKAEVLHGIITTTPEGTLTWVEEKFFTKPLNNHRAYIGYTTKNKELPQNYIDDLLNRYPPSLVDQYLNGIAVDFTGKPAHFDWTSDNVKEMAIPEFPIWHLGCDFNVDMCGWVLGCQIGDSFYIADEYLIKENAKIEEMVKLMVKQNCPKRIHLHVDKSSKSRNRIGDPEFTVLCRELKANGFTYHGTAEGSNPEVASRINLLNERILGGTTRRLFVSPKCEHLIRQFRKAGRTEDNHYDKIKGGEQYNLLESAGYIVWDLYKPVREEITWLRGRRAGI